LWYRVNGIFGAIRNQRDSRLLLLAIATTISLKKKRLKKNKKRGYGNERKDKIFIKNWKDKKPKKRILGWLLRREERIEKFLTGTLRLLFECLEEPKQAKKQPIQRKNVWKKGSRW